MDYYEANEPAIIRKNGRKNQGFSWPTRGTASGTTARRGDKKRRRQEAHSIMLHDYKYINAHRVRRKLQSEEFNGDNFS